MVGLLTRTQQHEGLPRAHEKLHLPTTQTPSVHQHQGTLSHNPHPPSADVSPTIQRREGNQEKEKVVGGSKALYYIKGLCPQAPHPHPTLKTIRRNSKKQSWQDEEEEEGIGRKEGKAPALPWGCDLRGVVLASGEKQN